MYVLYLQGEILMNYAGLYGKHKDYGKYEQRFRDLGLEHEKIFGQGAEVLFSAAGRTELGGNHTDHNLGRVLASAIDLDTIAAVHANTDNTVVFHSRGFKPVVIDISDLAPVERERETTASLIRGIAASVIKRGGRAGGFSANVASSVLAGSGLSSSASVEVLIGTVFNELFNGGRFSTTEIAVMGQEAENNYFGKPCGLMDQIACANGGIVGINFKNPAVPVITPVDSDFASYGYTLVIVSTGGSHADLTADYASIPAEMKSVAAFFSKSCLGELDCSLFYENIHEVRASLKNDRAVLRAMHFYEENLRVDAMIGTLRAADFDAYLDVVRECGKSSAMFLQNLYSPSDPRAQGLSMALAASEHFLGRNGACRLQGGGFAGTIQAYVSIDAIGKYTQKMEGIFGEGCCTAVGVRSLPALGLHTI